MHSMTAFAYRKVSTIERLISGVLLAVLLSGPNGLAPHASAQTAVTDDRERTVTLDGPASRIVSLAPSMTELLFSLGAGQRVVGVMAHSDFPSEARNLPVVGQHDSLDLERILSLRPDLVIAWQTGNPGGALRRLETMGIPVYVAEPESLEDIAVQLEKLAALTGQHEQGQELADGLRADLSALRDRYAYREPVSVFYQVWHNPLITVGGGELIDDIIGLCGGRNVFAGLPVGPKVSVEAVIHRNPEVIIGSGTDGGRPAWLDEWRQWRQLPAVEHGHVYPVDPDIIQRHSLRALQGAEQLCTLIDRARQP